MGPKSSTSPTTPRATSQAIPDQWPGAFKLYNYSKETMKVNIWTFVWLLVISFVFSAVISAAFPVKSSMYGFGQLLSYAVSLLLGAASVITILRSVKREKVTISDALGQTTPYLLQYFVLSIVFALICVVSLLALLFPFFIIVPRISLAPYFLFDQKLSAIDAIKASWYNTKGNVGKIWGIIGATIAYFLLVLTVIGIPVAVYLLVMYSASMVILYFWLQKNRPATQGPIAK